MIAAFDAVTPEPTHRKRRQPVRAHVLERGHRARAGAIEHDVLPEDPPRSELARDVARPGGGVPGIADIVIHRLSLRGSNGHRKVFMEYLLNFT